jgi:hypothetical protein
MHGKMLLAFNYNNLLIMSTYILQQNLPGLKAGAEIKPISALSYGYPFSPFCAPVHFEWANEYVETHPEWFKLKEDRLQVKSLLCQNADAENVEYILKLNKLLPPNSGDKVAAAIERAVNGISVELLWNEWTKQTSIKFKDAGERYGEDPIGFGLFMPTGISRNTDGSPKIANDWIKEANFFSIKLFEQLIKNNIQWEILSFKDHKNEGEYYTLWPNHENLYVNSLKLDAFTKEQLLEKKHDIHSVRRKDEQVFYCGKVYQDSMGRIMKPIKKFVIIEDVMYATFDQGYGNNDGCLGINSLHQLPERSDTKILSFYFNWDQLKGAIGKANPLFKYFNPSCCSIQSVERMDGNIFAIDEVISPKNGKIAKITGFEVSNGEMMVKFDTGCRNISEVEHEPTKKKLVLTTEDKKDIFEGDQYWYINSFMDKIWKCTCAVIGHKEQMGMNHKTFSSNEAATEYVLLNKPKFSIQQIMDRMHSYFKNPVDAFANLKSSNTIKEL